MKKVLVIEDNKDNLKLITYALKRSGYAVVAAETGEEGMELALRVRPVFIIMDIALPGIDGLEATRRIRESEVKQTIPIIAITSHAMQGSRRENCSRRLQRLSGKADRSLNGRSHDSGYTQVEKECRQRLVTDFTLGNPSNAQGGISRQLFFQSPLKKKVRNRFRPLFVEKTGDGSLERHNCLYKQKWGGTHVVMKPVRI